MKYDVFISYRRSSYDTANLIATRLKSAGYSVFFDLETMRAGKFNEQLLEVIAQCKDFVLVLPPGALDRCVEEDDWVRREVCHAMANKKNIIPVMLNGFTWPESMPEGMEELCNYQALTASSIEYFDQAMHTLQTRYLTSRHKLPITTIFKYIGITLSILLVLGAVVWFVFGVLAKGVQKKYAASITTDANYVHIIAEQNSMLQKEWSKYDNAISYGASQERMETYKENMLSCIMLAEKNLMACHVDTGAVMTTSEVILLTISGISAEDVAASPWLTSMYINDYLSLLQALRDIVAEPSSISRAFVNSILEANIHDFNAYYAAILETISAFPQTTRTAFEKQSPNWLYFPIHLYKMDEDDTYYENISKTESDIASEIMQQYDVYLNQIDHALNDLNEAITEKTNSDE